MYMLLSATPAAGIMDGRPDRSVRSRRSSHESLAAYLAERSRFPEALCAHYRYGESKRRVLEYYGVRESDWRFVHRLARDYGVDIRALVGTIPYEALEWHDELERRFVSIAVHLDPRALDDILLCALEAYHSPRRRKAYEVYGITLGMCRDVSRDCGGAGRRTTRHVSVMRAQPQLSAVAGPRYVEPNYRSLDALVGATSTLFPQQQLIGDFHSHVYENASELRLSKGWQPSEEDQRSSMQWIRSLRELGHAPEVDLIIAVARCHRRVPCSHYGGLPNKLQATVGNCRVIVSGYRILQSGCYAEEGVSLSVPGLPRHGL